MSSWCCDIGPSDDRAKEEVVQKSKKSKSEFVKKSKMTKADYAVNSKYMVAKYDIEFVLEEETTNDRRLKMGEGSLFKSAFSPETFKHAIFGITFPILLFYLFFYYVFQIPYLLDKMRTCETTLFNETSMELKTVCHDSWYVDLVKDWKDREKTMTRYLTFILGFYVGQMINRWWQQVKLLPEIDPITNHLAAFVQRDFDENEAEGAVATLELRKKVARYCLLSWTLCMSSISKPLNDSFNTPEQFMNKGLLTRPELNALKTESGSEDGWKNQWWTPITWAICLMNPLTKPQGFKAMPRDIVSAINKFQDRLEQMTIYRNHPLPIIYSQALNIAVYSWMILGILGSQDLSHELGMWDNLASSAFLHFPIFQCVKLLLIFGWMGVANVLRNPFGLDKQYDINLLRMLDHNIWKASLSIKNIHSPLPEDIET